MNDLSSALACLPRMNVDDIEAVQFISEIYVLPRDVLRSLRSRFREASGVSSVPVDAPLDGAEVMAIFLLSKSIHYGRWDSTHLKRVLGLQDQEEFTRLGKLPYYVLRTWQEGFDEDAIPHAAACFYKQICEFTGAEVPEYGLELDKHRLPVRPIS